MKKIHLYTLTTLFILNSITSYKNYLNINPISSFNPNYIFNNITNTKKTIINTYTTLNNNQKYNIHINIYYTYNNNKIIKQKNTPFPNNKHHNITHYNIQPNNTQLTNPFNQLYTNIKQTNIYIYYIPKINQYTNNSNSKKHKLHTLHNKTLTLHTQFYYKLIHN